MDLEIILWILSSVVIPVVTLIVGYFLGLRSQKTQSLHDYVIGTVKEQYPSLFSEMQRNSEYLDDFLEKPVVGFQFPVLTDFLKKGLGSLMKKHHADLFQSVNFFAVNVQPKFEELNRLRVDAHRTLHEIWKSYIHENLLPAYPEHLSDGICSDLTGAGGAHFVFSELLSKKHDSMAQKVEKCITERRMGYLKLGTHKRSREGIPVGDIDFQKATESLVELATPTIENILKVYAYLKEQNEPEIKGKLLPLLQKYIGKPV